MLNGHPDTVGLGDYEGDALSPRIEDGKIFGRGAFGMEGGIAAMMIAVARATTQVRLLHQAGIPCPLLGVDGDGAHAIVEWADKAVKPE